jgi:hypothetical protein
LQLIVPLTPAAIPVRVCEVTLTLQVAVLAPSCVVAVIFAVPVAMPLTTPVEDTVAMFVLSDDQDTVVFVAFDGKIVVVREELWQVAMARNEVFNAIPVTGILELTVTAQVAVFAPSSVVAVMVAVPVATAVTIPLLLTMATLVLSKDQVTDWLVALAGETVAISSDVPPKFKVKLDALKVTPETGTVTVITQVAVLLPSAVVTIMVAIPAPTAVTKPLALTVATFVLLDAHVTDWFVALAGDTVAVSMDVSAGVSDKLAELSVTPSTGTDTVNAQVAVLLPSAVVTVIVALPIAIAVITPLLSTVATLILSEAQVTD